MGHLKYIQGSSMMWRRLKEIARHEGLPAVLAKVWRKMKRFLFETNCSIWFERKLESPVDRFVPEIEVGIEFLTTDKMRLVDWLKQKHHEFPWVYFEPEIETALANGHIFTVLTHQGRLIGYVKIGVNRVYIHDFHQCINVHKNMAFVYDTFILPQFRGKKLAVYALNETMHYLASQHMDRLLCHIEKWNQPSIVAFERAGFNSVGTIRFVKCVGVPFYLKNGCMLMPNIKTFLLNTSTA